MLVVKRIALALACLLLLGQSSIVIPPNGIVVPANPVSSGSAGAMAAACPTGQALTLINSTTYTCRPFEGGSGSIPPGTAPQFLGFSDIGDPESVTLNGGNGTCQFIRQTAGQYNLFCGNYALLNAANTFTGMQTMPQITLNGPNGTQIFMPGGSLGSSTAAGIGLAGGATWGGTSFTATATTAAIMTSGSGWMNFWNNVGLTSGNTFSPSITGSFMPDGLQMASGKYIYTQTPPTVTPILLGGTGGPPNQPFSSIFTLGPSDIDLASGTHSTSGGMMADATTAGIMSISSAAFNFFANSGLTIGSTFGPTQIATISSNGINLLSGSYLINTTPLVTGGACGAGDFVTAITSPRGVPTCATPSGGGGSLPTPIAPFLTLQSNASNAPVWNANVGIGQAPGADPIDITYNINANAGVGLVNPNTGNAALGSYSATAGGTQSIFGSASSTYAGNPSIPASSTFLYGTGSAGISIYAPQTNAQTRIISGTTQVASFQANGNALGATAFLGATNFLSSATFQTGLGVTSGGNWLPTGLTVNNLSLGIAPNAAMFGGTSTQPNGVIQSSTPGNLMQISGAHYTGSSWIADNANAAIVSENLGGVLFYLNQGLTVGNSFVPTNTAAFGLDGLHLYQGNYLIGNAQIATTNLGDVAYNVSFGMYMTYTTVVTPPTNIGSYSYYHRVGKIVYVNFGMYYSSPGNGSGQVMFCGLPYAMNGNGNHVFWGIQNYGGTFNTVNGPLYMSASPNATCVNLNYWPSGADAGAGITAAMLGVVNVQGEFVYGIN